MIDRQIESCEEIGTTRSLHGNDSALIVMVDHLNIGSLTRAKFAHDFAGIRSIRDDQEFRPAPAVDDEVIDDPAVRVAHQRVLRLPVCDALEIVRQHTV